MKEEFTKQERDLLSAKTPKAYIDKCVTSKIASGRKAALTRYWLKKTGNSIEEIKFARNRHPYWKSKKMKGTKERNAARAKEHNYSRGKKIQWDDKLMKEFISLNKKDKQGNYEKKDWVLAKHFGCTIAAIQHLRRKNNMAMKIFAAKKESISPKKLQDMLMMGENDLRKMTKKLK